MTRDTTASPRLRMIVIAVVALFCAPIILVAFLASVSRSR